MSTHPINRASFVLLQNIKDKVIAHISKYHRHGNAAANTDSNIYNCWTNLLGNSQPSN